MRSLPKSVVVLATLLLAVLAFSVSAGSANAHGGHQHNVAVAENGAQAASLASKGTKALDRAVPFSSLEQSPLDASVMGASSSHGQEHGPKGASNCCCDGIICHAGVATAVDAFGDPVFTGTRLKVQPVFGHPQRWSSGPERPPKA